MKKILAFDIGGTQIKYGVVNQTGAIIANDLMDTEAHRGGPAIINKIIKTSNTIIRDEPINGIAISTAGQVNPDTGVIVGASELIPNYTGVNVKKLVSESLGLPVEVRNDVECAALGELWLGNVGADNFITLTVGTGIGGAIVIGGQLYSGHTYSAGEWGYMLVEGEPFEKNASVTGLIRFAQKFKEMREWTGKEIFDLYDQGDPSVKLAVKQFYRYLAIGISNLVYIFNPEKVIIGGGITARGTKFLEELQTEINQHLQPSFRQNTTISIAKLANHAGMIGAVYHFLSKRGLTPMSSR